MDIFQKCDGIYEAAAKQYKKLGEEAFMSPPILLCGQKYREIVYYKTSFKKKNREIAGVIFVKEDGTVVTDIGEKRELVNMTGCLEKICCSYDGKIEKTIINNAEFEKERRDYAIILKSFARMKAEGIEGTDTVGEILEKLPDVKIQNNNSIARLYEKIKIIDSNTVITSELINEIEPMYIETLMRNFEKIHLINKGRKYYDGIIKATTSRTRRVEYRAMGAEVAEGIRKAEYSVGYLKNMIKIYEKIIDMSGEQYLDFLKRMDRENINKKFEQIRNK